MAPKNLKCIPAKPKSKDVAMLTYYVSKPAVLHVIIQDHIIDKLELPCGVPETVEELESIVQQKYRLEAAKFTLHYKDVDFGGEFFFFSCINKRS